MDQLPHGSVGWLWWFISAIIFSFGINVLSAYSKPYTDRWLEKYIKSRKEKNDKYRKAIHTQALAMFNSQHRLTQLEISLHTHLLLVSLWFAVSIIITTQFALAVVPHLAIIIIGFDITVCIYMSLNAFRSVQKYLASQGEYIELLGKENERLSKKVEEKKRLGKQLEQNLGPLKRKAERKRKLVKLYKEWIEKTNSP